MENWGDIVFLEKLDLLMKQKGINKNILAKESGIPYTTIDGFYKKGYENTKLSTLKKLCAYFDVSLDYLADEQDATNINPIDEVLSKEEKNIIMKYRAFPQKYKNRILELIEGIEKEIKDEKEFNELLKKAQSLVEGKVAAYGGKMESVTLTPEESAELDELLKKAIAENGELL